MPWRVAVAAVGLLVIGCGQSTVPPTLTPTTAPTAAPTPNPTSPPTPLRSAPPTSGGGEGAHPPACGEAVLEWDGNRLLLATCVSQVDPAPTELIWAIGVDGWSLVSDDGPPPVVVTGAAWDLGRGVLVRYGGLPMSSNDCVAETWEWDRSSWERQPETDLGPIACDHNKLVYDPIGNGVLTVGGGDDDGNLVMDTWAWKDADWHLLSENGPAGRAHHGLVSDAGHGNVLLYGGYDGTQVFDDFWSWDGEEWEKLEFAGPGPRSHHGLAISDDAELLLFGGATGPQSFDTTASDTWLLTGGSWRQLDVEGPSARLSPALGFDQVQGLFILYGGFDASGNELADTWQCDGTAWACVDGCEV